MSNLLRSVPTELLQATSRRNRELFNAAAARGDIVGAAGVSRTIDRLDEELERREGDQNTILAKTDGKG